MMGVQYAVVRNYDRCRSGFLVICCFLATVLQAFGTGYYQIIPRAVNDGAYITLWDVSLCNAGTCGYPTIVSNFTVCNVWAVTLKAAAAFYVMGCVFVYFALVFAVLEFFAVGPAAVGVILAMIYVIVGIVGWAVIAGFYRGAFCGFVLSENHRLAAGWACSVAATGLVFIGVIFWWMRWCCCNPNKVKFSQAAGAPMVTGAVGVSGAPITYAPSVTTPMSAQCLTQSQVFSGSYTTVSQAVPTPVARVSYASPVARTMGPMVTGAAPMSVTSRSVSPVRLTF